MDVKNDFNLELSEVFVNANISFEKLNSETFKNFLFKYCKKNIPSPDTLWKNYIKILYNEKINEIRNYIGNNDFFLIIDDTTDILNRYILNVLIGRINSQSTKIYLLSTFFPEKIDNSVIFQAINDSCSFLYNNKINYSKLLLIITDQAQYMIKGIKNSKVLYGKSIHITCLIHGLHRLCEFIRKNHPVVDQFISLMKKLFKNSPFMRRSFQNEFNISLPPKVSIIRWGTWLNGINYYNKNLEIITKFVNSMNDKKNISKRKIINQIMKILFENKLKTDLSSANKFYFLVESIKTLSTEKYFLKNQLELINVIKKKLSGVYLEKFKNIIAKNPDLNFLMENNDIDYLNEMKYVPLVNISAERSFGYLGDILTHKRTNLSEENIIMLLNLYFNNK